MAHDSFVLFNMSWPEVKANLDKIKVAIIPTGSCEQHGPNGTFEVDSARANEFAKRLAERTYPETIAVPPVLYGVSPHHMNFPGTITMKPETFTQVCMDVVESLYRHGIKKFFIVNGHGGNVASLTVLLAKVKDQWPEVQIAMASQTSAVADIIKQKVTSPITGHACESEMSQCMYLAPWCVKTESLTKGDLCLTPEEYKNPWGVVVARKWEENTRNGALGDATKGSYELGKELMDTALDRLAGFVKEFASK